MYFHGQTQKKFRSDLNLRAQMISVEVHKTETSRRLWPSKAQRLKLTVRRLSDSLHKVQCFSSPFERLIYFITILVFTTELSIKNSTVFFSTQFSQTSMPQMLILFLDPGSWVGATSNVVERGRIARPQPRVGGGV